jgi:hypothetical protein
MAPSPSRLSPTRSEQTARRASSSGGGAPNKKHKYDVISPSGKPSGSPCVYCGRSRCTPNPCPNRHEGHFLLFANASCCMGCRNYINGPAKHRPAAELKAEVSKSEQKQADWKTGVESYEAVFNESAGKQVKHTDGRIIVPQWVDSVHEEATESRKLSGSWWPESALIAESVAYDKADLKPHTGETELGIVRSSSITPVDGCVQITTLIADRIQLRTRLGDSKHSTSSKDVKKQFDGHVAAAGKLVTKRKEGGDCPTT